ncbi:HsdM family class I SAM-dependent methyltransferase [Vibrio sp. V23_P3S9T160]|uniref:HsdM family class I SAM-dependent methyltransferase n=1 Tax=Vibrio sp. V23_P3S9T160 TaxID=1938675 RepID=UPI0013730CED|nr:N-6 DNA methylase [Vibrio sp. V23_P3S9T160]NAW99670.1 N-6 DNA methylase [Vibrio sp. V23_P3S9T160]
MDALNKIALGTHTKVFENNSVVGVKTKYDVVFAIILSDTPNLGEVREIKTQYPSVSIVSIKDEENSIYFVGDNKISPIYDDLQVYKSRKNKDVNSDNFEAFLFELHSVIRDLDGAHSDVVLDELCKLIFTKIYFEKNNKCFSIEGVNKFEWYSIITDAYIKACDGFALDSTEGISLSPSCVFELSSRLESVNFSSLPFDLKGRMFQKLISSSLRAGMGQYFTPQEIIELVVGCIDPKENELIIDPFCGSGHFLLESAKYLNMIFNTSYIENNIYGIEKNSRIFRVAMTDFMFSTGSSGVILHADSLLDFDNYKDNLEGCFDIVMTNPPFGSLLSSESLLNLSKFDLLDGKKNVPLEIIGMERSVELLKIGGRLGIVIPDSILTNKSNHYVREWIKVNLSVDAVISLPIETFSPFGASVKTSVLIATKTEPNSKSHNEKVFMAVSENIGYDASGRERKGSDIQAIIHEFKKFKLNQGLNL